MIKYIKYDNTPRMNAEVIVRLILNTCEPYMIKYPKPLLDTNNSPMMTPIRDMLILILKALIKFLRLLGNMTLKNIWNLLARILFISKIKLLSTDMNPL